MRGKIINHIYYKREKEISKLRIGEGSWSFNLNEVGEGDLIETLIYTTEIKEYRIPFSKAVSCGFQKEFNGELKLVIPIKYWEVRDLDSRTRMVNSLMG